MIEHDFKIRIAIFLSKYYKDYSEEISHKISDDVEEVFQIIKQHYNLREKEQDENHHQSEPS